MALRATYFAAGLVLLAACGSGTGSGGGIGPSGDPLSAEADPPLAGGENPVGEGGSGNVNGQGGSGNVGQGGSGGGGLTCQGVCTGCGVSESECATLCAQISPTQEQLQCLQNSNCTDQTCLTTGSGGTSGSGGDGGAGGSQCLEDFSSCFDSSECCSFNCSDGVCAPIGGVGGSSGSSSCLFAGEQCFDSSECCSQLCEGTCF